MKRLIERKPQLTLRSVIVAVLCSLLIILGCVLLASCGKTSPENPGPTKDPETLARERGAQIVSEYLKRDAAPYRQTRVRLTVTSTSEPSQVYELDIWRKQVSGETLTLTQIVQPAAQRNVASLTTERKGEDALNVTYVTANDQFRETGTSKSFFGGVTSQEFLGEWDKYDVRLMNEEEMNGIKSYEIEARLKPKRNSVIARLTALFRADTYQPAEMHAFDSDGQELRTFRVTEYRSFGGRAVVGRMDIENHIIKTTVVVEVLKMGFPDRMDDSLFTREKLKQIAKQ
ncbi:MAG TPA: outer membrane lipoprotein-sorting protein [Pyrinomonadaceae bacterium]|jgi:hypothetical protein